MTSRNARAVLCLICDAVAVPTVSIVGDAAVGDDETPADVTESQCFGDGRGVGGDAAQIVDQKIQFGGWASSLGSWASR
ncbi:hypothetical protein [Streptomyces sp. NPDC054804]